MMLQGRNALGALDVDELFQFALRAIGRGEHEQAIAYLKQALQLDAKNGKILYLLAAEHAEIGLYDRAAREMEEALRLEPDMPAARFQLGLLYITGGRLEQARETWQQLDALGEEHYFVLFRDGLLALAADQWDESFAKLSQGIRTNVENAPLNNDMQKVLDNIQQRNATSSAESSEDQTTTRHTFLSAYRDKENEHD